VTGGLRRIVRERRVIIVPLAVALALNAAIGLLVVYPSYARVGQAEEREAAALGELAAAQRELADATRTQREKARAEENLKTFYGEVLPADLAGARRATYLHLARLAKDAGLDYQRRLEESRSPKESDQTSMSSLTRFDITMVLEGDYEGVRQFLRDIEASESFIVIDNVGLAERSEQRSGLVLTVKLSTYYRTATRGI
jgi:Tfp pilus assembly protein PilO